MATRRPATTRKPAPAKKPGNPFDISSSTHMDEYVLPVLVFCGVFPLLGVGAWAWCQRAAAAQILVPGALVLFAGLGGFAMWHESKARTIHNRARATTAVVWMFLQPAVTIIIGPLSYAWTTVWFLIGFALA